jgi:hypothetical protein
MRPFAIRLRTGRGESPNDPTLYTVLANTAGDAADYFVKHLWAGVRAAFEGRPNLDFYVAPAT